LDFMGRHIQEARNGPLHASMLDDLTHFLIEHSLELLNSNDLAVASISMQNIIASHYLAILSLMSSLLTSQQCALSRRDNITTFEPNKVQQQWSDIK
jgi:hypothetical protein